MIPPLRTLVWRVVAALGLGAIVVLVIDLREQRQVASAQATDYVTALVGGETGRALIQHPLSVTAWRLNAPGARVVVPDHERLASLVRLLLDPESYDQRGVGAVARGGPSGPLTRTARAESTVRFENERGSLNIMVTADGSAMDILRDGGRISQACTVPMHEQLSTLLRQILDQQPAAAASVPPAH